MLIAEFSVITLTHCLSKLLEALIYNVLLFFGSVRFVVEELSIITPTHCPAKLLDASRYSLTFHRKLCTFCLLWRSRSSHRHCLAKLSKHRDTSCVFFPGKLCTCCGVLDRHTDTLSGEAVDTSGYDPLLFPRKLSTF